jgi:hypothetical protein
MKILRSTYLLVIKLAMVRLRAQGKNGSIVSEARMLVARSQVLQLPRSCDTHVRPSHLLLTAVNAGQLVNIDLFNVQRTIRAQLPSNCGHVQSGSTLINLYSHWNDIQ